MLVPCEFVKRTDEFGNTVREHILPEGYVVIDEYIPHSTPWDYHGMRHQREFCRVLGNVCNVALPNKQVDLGNPTGTGPGGSVRLGDAMTPGVFRIAVHKSRENAARQAIANHKAAVENWLFHNGPMPEACHL